MRKVGPTLALGLALLSYATQSETQQTAGRFRLGVDGTVLNAESGTISADAESGAIEADYGSTSAGLFSAHAPARTSTIAAARVKQASDHSRGTHGDRQRTIRQGAPRAEPAQR